MTLNANVLKIGNYVIVVGETLASKLWLKYAYNLIKHLVEVRKIVAMFEKQVRVLCFCLFPNYKIRYIGL